MYNNKRRLNMDILKNLYSEVMGLAASVIVKREDLATANETLESFRLFDRYERLLTSNTIELLDFHPLDLDIVEDIVGDRYTAYEYVKNYMLVPESIKYQIIAKHIERYRDNYEDSNNYYRQLSGLPDLEDKDFIYVKFVVDVDPNTPIHLLPQNQILLISLNGVLDNIIKNNPSKKYLRYLGDRKIDAYTARLKQHLDVLYISSSYSAQVKERFLEEYHLSRRYHMTRFFDDKLFLKKDYYSPFVGFTILVAAIRNTLAIDILDITNEDIMDQILRSYDLYERFKDFPRRIKEALVNNLDTLLMFSGSDNALLEVAKMFSVDNEISRYHLIKHHRTDAEGNPVFFYMADGSYDYERMYELEFLKVNIGAEDVLYNENKTIPFDLVTQRDKYWKLEPEMLVELKAKNFNIDIAKYISIDTSFNVAALTYEVSYFLNLLIDIRDRTNTIQAPNQYSDRDYSDLYTYVIFMIALNCRLSQFDGNINYDPVPLSTILKYNLGDINTTISSIISTYKLPITASDFILKSHLPLNMTVQDIGNVTREFSSIMQMLKYLMGETDDMNTYNGYSELYDLLFVSSNMQHSFRLPNGQKADTIFQLLETLDRSLYLRIGESEDEAVEQMLNYTLSSLDLLFDSLDFTFLFSNTPELTEKNTRNYFTKIVNLFMSSKTDLDSLSTFAVFAFEDNYTKHVEEVSMTSSLSPTGGVITESSIGISTKIYIDDSVDCDDITIRI
jgi:hypothetical protein